jgi:hypothetical protein
MPLGTQFGVSKTGLKTCVIRDIDVMTPRERLPPRALPDDVRASLGFAPKPASTGDKAGAAPSSAANSIPAPPPKLIAALQARKSLGNTMPSDKRPRFKA